MKLNLKPLLISFFLMTGMLVSNSVMAQSSNQDKASCSKDHTKTSCATSSSKSKTSGCSPSGCRGAKTKFGEAKVISNLRLALIDLKADMEKSKKTVFEARSYDIHGIIGKTDDESLAIIVKEVKVVEKEFSEKLSYKAPVFSLPESKAQQVTYLSNRIKTLKGLL